MSAHRDAAAVGRRPRRGRPCRAGRGPSPRAARSGARAAAAARDGRGRGRGQAAAAGAARPRREARGARRGAAAAGAAADRGGRGAAGAARRTQARHALVHVAELQVLGLDPLVDRQRGVALPGRLLGEREPVVEVEVADGDRLAADRLQHALAGEGGRPRLDEEPREQLRRRAVVLVGGRHALQEGDRLLAIARARGGLAALEREAGAAEQLRRAPQVAVLLEERGRRLELARLLVGGRGALLEPGAHVDAAGGPPALAGLVGLGGLGHHPHRLEQLGRAQVVAALEEERRGLGRLVGLERGLAPQGRRAHRVAGRLERGGGALVRPRRAGRARPPSPAGRAAAAPRPPACGSRPCCRPPTARSSDPAFA